jgi:hypothetical protein
MDPAFAAFADEFETRVRKTKLTGTTEVTLVYRCVDEQGCELPPVRLSLVPQTTVRGFGGAGQAFAAASHLDSILGNINSLVRHAPKGLTMLKGAPQVPLRIVGCELEIEDLAS